MNAILIQEHFAAYPFGAPCSDDDLAEAERRLSQSLPPDLRILYRHFNGFIGPTHAAFLYPLLHKLSELGTSLVEFNFFLRGQDYCPDFVQECIFYGDNGCGPSWGLLPKEPGKVIVWDAEWGKDYEIAGHDIFEVWLAEEKLYNELDAEKA